MLALGAGVRHPQVDVLQHGRIMISIKSFTVESRIHYYHGHDLKYAFSSIREQRMLQVLRVDRSRWTGLKGSFYGCLDHYPKFTY